MEKEPSLLNQEPHRPNLYLLVVVHIDNRLPPLASRNLALEHDVNLTVGSILHLRQVEVCCHQANKTGASPDVAAFAAHVSILHQVSNVNICFERGRKLTAELSM